MTVTLNTFDYILIAIVVLSSIMGLMRGFVRESLSLVVILVALWLAFQYSARVQFYFVDIIPNAEARLWAAVIAIILATLLIGTLIQKMILYFMKKAESTYLDKFMGFLFGIMRGFVVIGLIVWGISNTSLKEKPWWKDSGMVDYLQKSFAWVDQYRDQYTSVADNSDKSVDADGTTTPSDLNPAS